METWRFVFILLVTIPLSAMGMALAFAIYKEWKE